MRLKFNVLHEPWIPMANGEKHSLFSALENAAALEGVQCASPLETCAVYRLMIAFAMDALQLQNRDERTALLEQGAFDMRPFQEYAGRCEREGFSFDLFDAQRPFMQSAYDARVDGGKDTKPAANIVFEIPQGNNHTFFCHRSEIRLLPDEALRCLLSTYLFCPRGGRTYQAALNATDPCVYVLHRGRTLFETLVLNMLSIKECGNTAYGKPAWRAEAQVIPKKEFAKVDMLQGLTWRPRRVTLICGDDGCISRVYWKTGHKFTGNIFRRDPHVPYEKKGEEYKAIIPKEGRAIWRDIGALAKAEDGKFNKPPWVVENTPDGWDKYNLSAVGPVVKDASFLEILEENLQIPNNILENEEHAEQLRYDMQFLERCASKLKKAADSVSNRSDKKDKSHVLPLLLLKAFFYRAHGYIFGSYLEKLSQCETDEEYVRLMDDVHEAIRRILLQTLEKEGRRFGNDANNLLKQMTIRKKVLKEYNEERKKREDEWL